MSKQLAIYVWWSILIAISRSLLMNWPSGLPKETIRDVISAGKWTRHMMWCTPAVSGDVDAVLGHG